MEGTYDVLFGGEAVGKVRLEKQGLYACFRCSCELLESNMYHLTLNWPGGQEKLGLMMPCGDRLVLDTKIPAKRIGQGKFSFKLLPKHERAVGQFVPIYPEEPFAYLGRLEQAFLARQNSQTGIIFPVQKNVK